MESCSIMPSKGNHAQNGLIQVSELSICPDWMFFGGIPFFVNQVNSFKSNIFLIHGGSPGPETTKIWGWCKEHPHFLSGGSWGGDFWMKMSTTHCNYPCFLHLVALKSRRNAIFCILFCNDARKTFAGTKKNHNNFTKHWQAPKITKNTDFQSMEVQNPE